MQDILYHSFSIFLPILIGLHEDLVGICNEIHEPKILILKMHFNSLKKNLSEYVKRNKK